MAVTKDSTPEELIAVWDAHKDDLPYLGVVIDRATNKTLTEYIFRAPTPYFSLHRAKLLFNQDRRYDDIRKNTDWYVDTLMIEHIK